MRDDETVLVYSRQGQRKLSNIEANPKVSLTLDVTDIGRNIVRVEGVARLTEEETPADHNAAYLAKYTERIAALFDTPQNFAEHFSTAIVISPTKLHI
jgi:PPOX class probable F420-dependent enzyme